MEKLVRDGMPTLCETDPNRTPMKYRVAINSEELAEFLLDKLVEESKELRYARTRLEVIEELADIQEVLRGLTSTFGLTKEVVEEVRQKKFGQRGGFYLGIIWDGKK